MINKKFKKGFSLIQLMVALIVLSVLLAASVPMITKAHKKIPTKAPHGMYLCYWQDGNLIEEYYNARTRVSRVNHGNDATACKFDTPSEVAAFQVELISGGAGGNYYNYITDQLDDPKTTKYDMRTGLEDNTSVIYEPTNEILRKGFNGKTVTVSAPTGYGKDGQTINYTAYLVQSSQCISGNQQQRASYNQKIREKYSELQLYTTDIIDDLNNICKDCIGANQEPKIEKWPSSRTIEGKKGTPNGYLTYSYEIEIPEKEKDIANWLKQNVGQIVAGKCSNIDCSDFSATPINTYENYYYPQQPLIIDFDTDINEYDKFIKANNGEDQDFFAAIRKEDGTYKVASAKAIGGAGATLWLGDNYYLYESLETKSDTDKLLEDASKIPDTSPADETNIPTMNIETQTNYRTYEYGIAGSSGEYQKHQFAQLKDCQITVGKGGTAGTSNDNNGGNGGNTSLSCKNPDIDIIALGGVNNQYSYTTTETKHLFELAKNYQSLQIDLINENKYYETELSEAEEPINNNDRNTFTSFKNFPNIKFGQGGSGTKIVDKLLDVWGTVNYTVDDELILSDEKEQKYNNNDLNTSAIITEPTNGQSGAIIITW